MAEESKMETFIKSIVEALRQMATTETVVGKPITIEDTTVVPVIKFSVGFGAGGVSKGGRVIAPLCLPVEWSRYDTGPQKSAR